MEENVTNYMGIVIELGTRYGINFIFAILGAEIAIKIPI